MISDLRGNVRGDNVRPDQTAHVDCKDQWLGQRALELVSVSSFQAC